MSEKKARALDLTKINDIVKEKGYDEVFHFGGPMATVKAIINQLPHQIGKQMIHFLFEFHMPSKSYRDDKKMLVIVGDADGTDREFQEWCDKNGIDYFIHAEPSTKPPIHPSGLTVEAAKKMYDDDKEMKKRSRDETLTEDERKIAGSKLLNWKERQTVIQVINYGNKWSWRDKEMTDRATSVRCIIHPDELDNSTAMNIIRFHCGNDMDAYEFSCAIRERKIYSEEHPFGKEYTLVERMQHWNHLLDTNNRMTPYGINGLIELLQSYSMPFTKASCEQLIKQNKS